MERFPNIIMLLNLPGEYIPKAEFVLRTFCYLLRLNPAFVYGRHYEGAHLYYGPKTGREYPLRIHYEESTAGFFQERDLYPLDKVDFCLFRKEYIPFLFSLPGAVFSFSQENVTFRKDIVASAFYFLTCWHEFILGHYGETRGRVDFRQSLQYRWDFTDIPVVDVYCQMLLYVLGMYLPQFIRPITWSKERRFSVSLSHDIDYWNYWVGEQKISAFKYNLRTFAKRPVTATYKLLGHTVHKNLIHNPHRQMSWILERERKLHVRATWFLFGKDNFEDQRQNYIADPKISGQLLKLLDGQEVGLHGSPASAYDAEALRTEMQALQKAGFSVTGYRSHYLNFDYQQSFKILEEAGIKYDSTLGYWEHIGFRAGISFPFFPYNIEENRPFRVLEIPLIVMDTTLYSKKAMNLSPVAAKRRLKALVDLADKYQSHLSLLWHNVSFDPIDYTFWAGVYWSVLRYALGKDAWVTSLHDIYTERININ